MSIKVNFEIGHEASIRTKKTPDGFTHDWEIFVRGIDSADISQFVDKIVFQLHDTFPKPKRVVKEPPYSVRESGYAGFNLPIEIYLKNRDEPKKIRFNYDLHLQQTGPAIIKVQKEKYVFMNPSDDFRRKLLKGGGMIVSNVNPFSLHSNIDHERNSRDSFTDEKPQQLIGKPKLGGDSSKKHKTKDRIEDLPRPTNSFVNLFGPPIHKTSRVSPDPKKPSPNPKQEKKEKEKSHSEKDKTKTKHDIKEKDYNRDDKTKQTKEEKDKGKEEKKSKPYKERDSSKEKGSKRPAERPPSPTPPTKRPVPASPSPKPTTSLTSKEEIKPSSKYPDDIKPKVPTKVVESEPNKLDKKVKKDKKSHDKDRENKKEHKREKESKMIIPEIKETKIKETPTKEIPPIKEKEKEKIPVKPEKPINKFSIENMLKDPSESKYGDGSKHKDKSDRERKHKHKKKDKKRDESREKNKDSSKEKKHKHDKHFQKEKALENKEIPILPEKVDNNTIPREIDKTPVSKSFKEKERSQLTISPISVDTSSQSSSKSASKVSKSNKITHNSMMDAISCSSSSDTDVSVVSEDEDNSLNSENTSRSAKSISKPPPEPVKSEPVKSVPVPETSKVEKPTVDKSEKTSSASTSHKSSKSKDKSSKHESKEEKKQRKRKSSSKTEEPENASKVVKSVDESDHVKNKRSDSGSNLPENNTRVKSEPSSRVKTDTKVQDDGVSSSLSDHPLKCDSPMSEDTPQIDRKQISPDYMLQLKELQHRIMTIQSNDELERVVNLIAETGKYEVTKKTFDFDLCLLDRSTVQQLQELIGCESRA